MNRFYALVVDDEQPHLELTRKHFEGEAAKPLRPIAEAGPVANARASVRGEVTVRTAATVADARRLLAEHFFHLALVDARLDPNDNHNFEGLALLSDLKELRPSCERVVVSYLFGMMNSAPQIVLEVNPLAGSGQGRAHHLLHKNPSLPGHLVVEDRAYRWLANRIDVVGADVAAAALRERLGGRPGAAGAGVTEAEVEYLVSRVFGQGQPWNQGAGVGIAEVRMAAMDPGFSSAAVLRAQCYSETRTPGIWCVLKFADRAYVERELVRYTRYVRYRLAVHHRVELLGWETADRLGVLCYNFASPDPDHPPVSLGALFRRADDRFFRALDDLHSPGKKGWYAETVSGPPLGTHFHATYGVDVAKLIPDIHDLAGGVGTVKNDKLTVGGATVELPSHRLFSNPVFADATETCVVHGDMHCDNILVGAGDRPNMIDYYYVDNGPRALDFATLEGSVRLLHLEVEFGAAPPAGADDPALPALVALLPVEAAARRAAWAADPADPDPDPDPDRPFWVRASRHLCRLARLNHDGLQERTYAATCVMWAMRLLKVEQLTPRQRVRLLVWVSPYITLLNAAP